MVMKTHFQFNNCFKHFALLDPYNVMYVCMLFGKLGAGTVLSVVCSLPPVQE